MGRDSLYTPSPVLREKVNKLLKRLLGPLFGQSRSLRKRNIGAICGPCLCLLERHFSTLQVDLARNQ
jgi:hypothetical protein